MSLGISLVDDGIRKTYFKVGKREKLDGQEEFCETLIRNVGRRDGNATTMMDHFTKL